MKEGDIISTSSVLLAFALTLFAGLSTGIGSLIAFFAHKTNKKFLSVALGFSAGIMIYVSFVELLSDANIFLRETLGNLNGSIIVFLSFFGGMFLIAVIDRLVPEYENPHAVHSLENPEACMDIKKNNKLMKVGITTAIAIIIHNIPEGLAAFASTINNAKVGIVIAIAIAIHNIPEGIAVSVPIYCATGSKRKAFKLSFLSGLSELFGAILGFLILMPFINNTMLGIIYGAVAGIMIFISFDELLPTAREYGEHHLSIYGLIGGMATMAISLVLLKV